jgi:hypothetical protein
MDGNLQVIDLKKSTVLKSPYAYFPLQVNITREVE